MDEKRQSRLAPAMVSLAVLLPILLIAAYVAGYFWLGKFSVTGKFAAPGGVPPPGTTVIRVYPFEWLAWIYRPAGDVEERLRGDEVLSIIAGSKRLVFGTGNWHWLLDSTF
jgi:hypothetical protein